MISVKLRRLSDSEIIVGEHRDEGLQGEYGAPYYRAVVHVDGKALMLDMPLTSAVRVLVLMWFRDRAAGKDAADTFLNDHP